MISHKGPWCSCCDRVQIHSIHVYDRIEDGMCDECSDLCNKALDAIVKARRDGFKYPPNYWRTDPESHLEHATTHVYMHRRGDTTEDHLAHAICRLVMEYAKNEG